jgi:hypothetical protein
VQTFDRETSLARESLGQWLPFEDAGRLATKCLHLFVLWPAIFRFAIHAQRLYLPLPTLSAPTALCRLRLR